MKAPANGIRGYTNKVRLRGLRNTADCKLMKYKNTPP
jgi:hypothetical protein